MLPLVKAVVGERMRREREEKSKRQCLDKNINNYKLHKERTNMLPVAADGRNAFYLTASMFVLVG